MPPPRVVYWDSCIWIAWLKNERRTPGEMDGVAECVDHVETGKTTIVSSVVVRTEVFEATLPSEARQRYDDILKRRNVQLVDNDLRVSNLAREIREYYESLSATDHLPGLATPDAIHLATAIHYKVDAFYTFDDGRHGGRSLLSLNGNVAGHPLAISIPQVTQYRMPI
jgi:predicted nucleic acid-binding protein